jgi:hypothetical protein
VATLTLWAFENALDAPVPDPPENMQVPEQKKRYQRIKLGRMRRARQQSMRLS